MAFSHEILKKPLEYIFLISIFLAGLISFYSVNTSPFQQRLVIFFTADAYLVWSVYHHYRRGDLHFSIVAEYLAIILLAMVVLFGPAIFSLF